MADLFGLLNWVFTKPFEAIKVGATVAQVAAPPVAAKLTENMVNAGLSSITGGIATTKIEKATTTWTRTPTGPVFPFNLPPSTPAPAPAPTPTVAPSPTVPPATTPPSTTQPAATTVATQTNTTDPFSAMMPMFMMMMMLPMMSKLGKGTKKRSRDDYYDEED